MFDFTPSHSIFPIGEKNKEYKDMENNKEKITVITCVSANGQKLKPFIIFKGKPYKTIYKNEF